MNCKIVALGGGVGAAKFLKGLYNIIDQGLTIVVNTGDDINLYGLRISPDLDTVFYWICGKANNNLGWGIENDSFQCLSALGDLGEETWFKVGDRDFATHIFRTMLRSNGVKPSDIIRKMLSIYNIKGVSILPMTDNDVETWVQTDEGEMHFQEYLVKNSMKPNVRGVIFKGVENALPAPGVIESIQEADLVIMCPSNPIISIGPILEIHGVRDALRRSKAKKIAINPLVGGSPLKGPADKLMSGLGMDVSSRQIGLLYKDFLDILIIDNIDSHEVDSISEIGVQVFTKNIIISDASKSEELAREVMKIGLN